MHEITVKEKNGMEFNDIEGLFSYIECSNELGYQMDLVDKQGENILIEDIFDIMCIFGESGLDNATNIQYIEENNIYKFILNGKNYVLKCIDK